MRLMKQARLGNEVGEGNICAHVKEALERAEVLFRERESAARRM